MPLFEKSFPGNELSQSASHESSRLTTPELSGFTSPSPELSRRNMQVKKAMSGELTAMGLSPEAIARILHLDRE